MSAKTEEELEMSTHKELQNYLTFYIKNKLVLNTQKKLSPFTQNNVEFI